ncbi:MAG: chloride channel protein [Enterococcus sp.]
MKFNSVFLLYSSILGFLVGVLAAFFLTVVNFLIHFVWTEIPSQLDLSYYPILVGLLGGLVIGTFQLKVGDYPKTMHATLHEFKETGAVSYKGQISKNTIGALIVLAFGASLGPEAALAGILGGLITWVGDHLKWTVQRRKELLELGIGAMVATIFHAPLMGLGEAIDEEELRKTSFKNRQVQLILYSISTVFGIWGFSLVNQLFPKEAVFTLNFSSVEWQLEVLWLIIPALILGVLFGNLFLVIEKLMEALAKKIVHPMVLALLAGLGIGVFGMISTDFLFSGEHQIHHFSEVAMEQSVLALSFLALGKAFLTNLCFSFGWRGGKIFPAIFSSTAIGFALSVMAPTMPSLVIGIVVAASVTVILNQPIVTATLLLFLFPVPLFPIIFATCYGVGIFSKRWRVA